MENLSNLQLELLKAYSRPVSDEDIKAFRQFLAGYFAKKSMDLADAAWDKNGWKREDSGRLMNEHLRAGHND